MYNRIQRRERKPAGREFRWRGQWLHMRLDSFMYAVKIQCELDLQDFEFASPIMLTLKKRFVKYLADNPRPRTFGEFAFVFCKLSGIKTIVFNRAIEMAAKDGMAEIDRQIKEKLPFITNERIDMKGIW